MRIPYPSLPWDVDYQVQTGTPGPFGSSLVVPVSGWEWWALAWASFKYNQALPSIQLGVVYIQQASGLFVETHGNADSAGINPFFSVFGQAAGRVTSSDGYIPGELPLTPILGDGTFTLTASGAAAGDVITNVSYMLIGHLSGSPPLH